MKWMIASDLHGDAVCTAALLQQFKSSGAERLVLLGDLLYHGPRNDLPSGYAPKQVIALLNDVRDSLVCVRGNCDTEVDQMVLKFPILSDTACIFADGRTYITTQNHGYEVVGNTVKEGEISFINVNDGSCEGIDYEALNAFTVQFTPESCGIGHPENVLYNKFFAMMEKEN